MEGMDDSINGKIPLNGGIFFDELVHCLHCESIVSAYRIMENSMRHAIDYRLRDSSVRFTGVFSMLQYLFNEYRLYETDKNLCITLNNLRGKLSKLDRLSKSGLSKSFPYDLKSLCIFISLVYGNAPIPDKLKAVFPPEDNPARRQQRTNGKHDNPQSIRCIVTAWNSERIYGVEEKSGCDVEIDYIHNDSMAYIADCISKGDILSLIRPRYENDVLYPELIVVNPDFLVNVTTIAACFEDYGIFPMASVLNKIKPRNISSDILLGNFAGQLLDEFIYDNDTPYNDSIRNFFRENIMAILTCDGLDTFHERAMEQKGNISHIIRDVFPKEINDSFKSDRTILEPSFISPILGIQGRMDWLDMSYRIVVEQKAGKAQYRRGVAEDVFTKHKESHYIQVQLYRALLHYGMVHIDNENIYSFLLYSKYRDGLVHVATAPKAIAKAIEVRNKISCMELSFGKDGYAFLSTIKAQDIYPKAQGLLWEKYVCPQTEKLLAPIRNASLVEREYYLRFMKFVSTEHILSKLGNREKEMSGFASVWNSTLEEKREAGCIYERLGIIIPDTEGKSIEKVTLRFGKRIDNDSSDFRVGDIVMFYPYRKKTNPDATNTILFRGSISAIGTGSMDITLRHPQTDRKVFMEEDSFWAVEHDCMDSLTSSLYSGLYLFLTTDKRRRDLLLCQRKPETDKKAVLKGDYGSEEFNTVTLKAIQAKDIFIIIGPPGTGKTSHGMLNIVKEHLLDDGSNILLTAYTNRAVDEICSKLKENGIEFMRIGSENVCAPEYRDSMLRKRMESVSNINEARIVFQQTRVICATTSSLSSHPELFRIKNFDIAVIDEASQILEPQLIGILCAMNRNGDGLGISKFVMIGDEKQLPAVVQQSAKESIVNEKVLRDIGLVDCRLSLFERMLRWLRTANKECIHQLTSQGRMHPDIADFPNTAFYYNMLKPVPVEHQLEKTEQCTDTDNGIEQILTAKRMVFVNSHRNLSDNNTSDGAQNGNENRNEACNVNSTEAGMIAATVVQAYKIERHSFNPLTSIGVIVPYRNQISEIRNKIDEYGIKCLHDITIDTVERFQGSQRDIIIYGFTVSTPYQLLFLESTQYVDRLNADGKGIVIDRKLNVAMTRARKRLVIIGDRAILNRDIVFKGLIDYAVGHGSMVDVAPDDYIKGKFSINT